MKGGVKHTLRSTCIRRILTYIYMGPHKFMRSCIEHKGERESVVVSFVLLSRQSRFFFFDERGGGGR